MIDALRALSCLLVSSWCAPTTVVPPAVVPVVTVIPEVPREIPREVLKYRNVLIREIRYTWGDAEPTETFFGQVHAESRWVATARSPVGAAGLTQFMPATAEWIQGLYAKDLKDICGAQSGCPYDPRWALRALVLYDKRLYDGYGWAASKIDRQALMLAAYNGGAGHIAREKSRCGSMPPIAAYDNESDCYVRYPVARGQLSVADMSSGVSESDFTYLRCCELRGIDVMAPPYFFGMQATAVLVTPGRLAFLDSVKYIIQVGAGEEMIWIQARRVVALMADEQVGGQRPNVPFVHEASYSPSPSSIKRIAVLVASTLPDPTGLSSENQSFDPFSKRSFTGWHAARVCDVTRWFKNIELVCLRSSAACDENRSYVHAILERWAPLYRAWLLR